MHTKRKSDVAKRKSDVVMIHESNKKTMSILICQ